MFHSKTRVNVMEEQLFKGTVVVFLRLLKVLFKPCLSILNIVLFNGLKLLKAVLSAVFKAV